MNYLSPDDFDSDSENYVTGQNLSSNNLPIFNHKEEIIKNIKENQVIIINGDTGCGKTTQIPQYILDANLNNMSTIGVTQPRKIAAISMAKRVARERQCALGKEVGYEIRFSKKCSASTKIKYMTDGILLNECITNRFLKEYNILIVDEAHERSVNSDVILGLLKAIIKDRKDLKIIITSATMSVEKFSKYFNDAKIMKIEGQLHPVEVIYTGFSFDYVKKASEIVHKIHSNDEKGDILIFLTGEEEIEDCCYLLEENPHLIVKPFYAGIDFESQHEAFEPVKPGERKAIVATNMAETSLTFNGVRFVFDCGYVKQSNFDSRRGIDILESVRISKAQAEQRTGRAGRVDSGWCYRLYSQECFENLKNEALPEILRKNLSGIYLKLVEFDINPETFEFLDQPTEEELARSKKELQELKLIDINSQLTGHGKKVVKIPVEPCLGKVIITSVFKKCSNDVVKIISMLSEKYIFKRPRKFRNKADEARKQFIDPDGDQFTFLNVYNKWEEIMSSSTNKKLADKNVRKWCQTHFVDYEIMKTVDKVINQIQRMIHKEFQTTENDGGRMAIKRSIVSGYFRNISIKQNRDSYIRFYGKEVLYIHPNSALFTTPPELILFHEVRKTNKSYMHGVMRLDNDFINEFPDELKIINYTTDVKNLNKVFLN